MNNKKYVFTINKKRNHKRNHMSKNEFKALIMIDRNCV